MALMGHEVMGWTRLVLVSRVPVMGHSKVALAVSLSWVIVLVPSYILDLHVVLDFVYLYAVIYPCL